MVPSVGRYVCSRIGLAPGCFCAPAGTRCRHKSGTELLVEAGPALDRLAAVSQRLREPMPTARLLRVSALPTFAMRWLIPRLPEFQRDHPGLELRIVTASTPAEQFRMDVDAVISGPWRQSGWVGKPFLREARLPVLSPDLMEKCSLQTPSDLERHTLTSRRDIALGVAAMARRRPCPRAEAGARAGLRGFLFCDPGGAGRAWGDHGPGGADQR